jgi:alpha-mannosidase
MGHHDFSFAIMPHTGRLVESDVVRDALRFTNPPVRKSQEEVPISLMLSWLIVVDTVRRGVRSEDDLLLRSRLTLTGPTSRGIILETIKRGENDDFSSQGTGQKTIIMRLYEGLGGRARGRLSL